MRRNVALDPSGFTLEGGPVGCVLIHGFTGSAAEMRPLGEYLHRQGLTVHALLLPGHGTQPQDLNCCAWKDWADVAEQAYRTLTARCAQVFVAGLSMGALLTLHLAVLHPEIGGIILYSPALRIANRFLWLLPIARHVIRYMPKKPPEESDLVDPRAGERLWDYDVNPVGGAYELLKLQRVVRRELRKVCAPALVFYSSRDEVIHPSAGRATYRGLGSTDKELVTLHRSGHAMLIDAERESIFERTYAFIASRQ